jgi:uncharacterized integral membrane protein
MIAILRWMAGATLALALVVFSVYNRQSVSVTFHPLYDPIDLPLYALVLSLAAAAFLTGAALIWSSDLANQIIIRRLNKRIEILEKDLESLKNQPIMTPKKAIPFLQMLGYKGHHER